MATAAEPRPASLPLAGGRDGATVRLRPLLTGKVKFPRAALLREEGRLAGLKAMGVGGDWHEVPIPAFCVEHPGAGVLLIDTGLHPSVAVDPKQNLGRLPSMVFKDLEMKAEDAAPAQLRRLGIGPVRTVVMTHLHVDHASAVSEFPDATFVVSSREWAAATDQGPIHGYTTRQFDHAFDYRTLDFDSRDADSFSAFGRSFDLFGDGSVRLVYTPGHSLGHLSVVLRLRTREVLITGDAVQLMANLRDKHLPHRMEDEHLYRRSLREIELYTRETPGALIVPGHDLDAWNSLDEVYE